jgi:hypothetical protein
MSEVQIRFKSISVLVVTITQLPGIQLNLPSFTSFAYLLINIFTVKIYITRKDLQEKIRFGEFP